MSADSINDTIDKLYNVSEGVARDFLLEKALLAFLGTTTGFFAMILTPIVKMILEATAFKLLREVKRNVQMVVDIIDGHIVIRRVEDAIANNDEQAYIDAVSDY